METFKKELIGKIVMSGEGIPIGIIKESLLDKNTGDVKSILIEPSKDINISNYKLNNQGRIILPFENISHVKDIVIIEKELFNNEF